MIRTTVLLTCIWLMIASASIAQQRPPNTPEDAFSTRELIAWSQLQKPQPAPQPLPPRDTPIPQPEQPPDQQSKSLADPHGQQDPVQSFTGKIVKEEAQYVLRVSGSTRYSLVGAGDLQKYQNQNVRIAGKLDGAGKTIRVMKIDLL